MGETTEVFFFLVLLLKLNLVFFTISAYRDKLEVATNSDQVAFQVVN